MAVHLEHEFRSDFLGPFGIMHQMWTLPSDSDAEFLEQTIDDIRLGDELGYDSVWIAEHHYVRDAPFYSRLPDPEILIARLIGETQRIRLATGIKILYLDEPARVVERLRLLDILSGQRVLYGLGQGSPDELGTIKLTTEERRQGFRAKLRDFSRYLETGRITDEVRIVPNVEVPASATIWVGVRDSVTIAQAAELGMNFIVGEAEPGVRQAKLISAYRDAGGTGETRGARLVCVAETEEEAFQAAVAPGRRLFDQFSGQGYYQEAVAAGALPEEHPRDLREMLERIEYVVGTPDVVAEQLAAYVATTGVDALNILVHSPGMEAAAARRSLELFAVEVAPRLLRLPIFGGDGTTAVELTVPRHGGVPQC